MNNEDLKFKVTDPMGRKVILKNDTWTEHIQKRHGECLEEDIISNIQNPCYILTNTKPSKDGSKELMIDQSRNDYVSLTIKGDRLYAQKTIVDYSNSTYGIVVTNYIQRNANEINTTGGVIYDRKESSNTK